MAEKIFTVYNFLMKAAFKCFVGIGLIGLCGCAGTALHHAYADFSDVYADSINRQLLLNLARMAHDEPAYFIQLGTINSQYQFNTSIGISPNNIGHSIGADGSFGTGVSETPTFNFVPLNGDSFAQAIAAPISIKIFYTFYDQGFDADLLVRTMVASIKKEVIKSGTTNYEYYVNNPNDRSYPYFLEFCRNLHEEQHKHTIVLTTGEKESVTIYRNTALPLGEAINAINAGFAIRFDTNSNQYAVTKLTQNFELTTNSMADRSDSANYSATSEDGKVSEFAAGYHHYEFKMRTFESAMYGLAKEEIRFRELKNAAQLPYKNVKYSEDSFGLIVTLVNGTNHFSFRPVLKINYDEPARSKISKLTEVRDKAGNVYTVGDLEGAAVTDDSPKTSNRFVFTLVSYLFSQISLDPQKLPVQQLIQVP